MKMLCTTLFIMILNYVKMTFLSMMLSEPCYFYRFKQNYS